MNAPNDRLVELLTDRALVGLSPREQIELAELLVLEQDLDPGAFDNAASALALAAMGGRLEPMPEALAASIEAKAITQLAAERDSARPSTDYHKTREMPAGVLTMDIPAPATVKAPAQYQATLTIPLTPSAPPSAASVAPVSNSPTPSPPPTYGPPPASAPSNVIAFPAADTRRAPRASNLVAVSGWIAAAACLLIAIGAFYIRRPQPVVVVSPQPIPTPSVIEAPTPPSPPMMAETAADLRKRLLAMAGTLRSEWASTKDPAGKAASGEVVWNKEQQRGTMTFRGLGRNDATHSQYQLWIFDKGRDDKYPVDGGVFDIDAETGDVTVPIKAVLPVNNPTLFAVTIEKPGGVVVSKREHLVLTAKL